jgi:hypothetical protein
LFATQPAIGAAHAANRFEFVLAAVLAGFAALTLFGHSPVESVAQTLRADSASPYRWCDLGEERLQAGKTEQARACFRRAVQFAPNIPPIWMRSINFYLQVDDIPAALACTTPVLRLVSDYDGVIFSDVDHLDKDAVRFLPHIADNRRDLSAYFRHLLAAGDVASAQAAWLFAKSGELTAEYVDFLLRQHRYEAAVTLWADQAGTRTGDAGSRLDWRLTPVDGVETICDKMWLRIRFQGTGNVDYHHVEQWAWVKPGVYRFQAEVQILDLTTDQGLQFHLFDAESPHRLDFTTEQLTGTHDWTRVEKTFLVPREPISSPRRWCGMRPSSSITRSPAKHGSTRFRWFRYRRAESDESQHPHPDPLGRAHLLRRRRLPVPRRLSRHGGRQPPANQRQGNALLGLLGALAPAGDRIQGSAQGARGRHFDVRSRSPHGGRPAFLARSRR